MTTWPLLAPSAIVALARLTRRERRFTVLAAESISHLLAVPTLVGLSVGVATRRRDLTAVAGGLALAHLAWALPQLRPPRGVPDDDGGTAVRLLSFNLLFINLDMGAVATELRKADADVLLLQEMSRANLELLEKEELLDAYPHRLVDARPDALGSAIYSRLPLADADIWRASGFPMARATVIVNDRRLRVYDVHTRAPFGPGAYEHWIRQLQGLGDAAASERHPVVLAGDYNVMPTELDVYKPERWVNDALFRPETRAAFKTLTEQGWTDAIRKLYPDEIIYTFFDYFRNAYARNAGLRIDHFLLSPHFNKLLVGAGVNLDVRGWEKTSDHAPVWIEVE